MPFEPITEYDMKKWELKICKNPQHNPPGMIVITKPMKWVCPGCGESVILYPQATYWQDVDDFRQGGETQSERFGH